MLFSRSGARELMQFIEYFKNEESRFKQTQTAHSPVILNIKDYGAKGDGIADDSPAFIAIIDAVNNLNGIPTIIKIPSGTYLLNSPKNHYRKKWNAAKHHPAAPSGLGGASARPRSFYIHIPLIGLKNLTIEGENDTVLLFGNSAWAEGFGIYGCENVTLRNLAIDYKNLPFSQGTILSVDQDSNKIVWRKEEGYPDPTTPLFFQSNSAEILGLAIFYHKKGFYRTTFRNAFKKGIRWITDDLFEIHLADTRTAKATKDMKSGMPLAFRARYNGITSAILTQYCKFFTAEDVSIYTSPFSGIQGIMNYSSAYIRLKIIPRPGTTRLISTIGDGVPYTDGYFGPYLSACTFKYCQDDSLISTTRSRQIDWIHNDKAYSLGWQPFFSGAAMRILNPNTGKVFMENECSGYFGNHTYSYKPPLPKSVVTNESMHDNHFDKKSNLLLYIDAKKTKILPDRALCVERSGIGLVISNCTFMNGAGNACDVETPNAIVEYNIIKNYSCFGIGVVSRDVIHESLTPHNVLIRGNNVSKCGASLCTSYNHEHGISDFITVRDLLIEHNVFAHPRWNYNLIIQNTADAIFRNNRFYPQKAYPDPMLKVTDNIKFENNIKEIR